MLFLKILWPCCGIGMLEDAKIAMKNRPDLGKNISEAISVMARCMAFGYIFLYFFAMFVFLLGMAAVSGQATETIGYISVPLVFLVASYPLLALSCATYKREVAPYAG